MTAATAAALLVAFALVLLYPASGAERASPPTQVVAPPVIDTTSAAEPPLEIAVDDPQGGLNYAVGRLWWVGPGCKLTVMEVAANTGRRASDRHCRAWPSPDGERVVATVGGVPTARRFERLALLDGSNLTPMASVPVAAGDLVGPLAWAPRGERVGMCLRSAPADAVTIFSVDPVSTRVNRGRCTPAWLADGRLLQSAGSVLSIGTSGALQLREVIDPDGSASEEGTLTTGARPAITAIGVGAERIVVGGAIVGGLGSYAVGDAHLMVLDQRGRVLARRLLPRGAIATAVGISPDGALAWWIDGPTRVARIVALDGEVPAGLPPEARGYAWSPDGGHVAAALADAIVIVRLSNGARTRVPDTPARALAWTP